MRQPKRKSPVPKQASSDHIFLEVSALLYGSEIDDIAAQAALMARDNAEQVQSSRKQVLSHLEKARAQLAGVNDRTNAMVDRLIFLVQAVEQIKESQRCFLSAQTKAMLPAAIKEAKHLGKIRRSRDLRFGSEKERVRKYYASFQKFLLTHSRAEAIRLAAAECKRTPRTIERALAFAKRAK